MITIDGSFGEGGGQILRTSLALAILTGQGCMITNIRAGRQRPGLLRQHLTALKAAAEISGAAVSGDELGSMELTFKPAEVSAGSYTFDIGSAGSVNLVLQTILPPLMMADGPSEITIIGGTHNPQSPSFHYLKQVFLPVLARMGVQVEMELLTWGFYPAGGGKIRIKVTPAQALQPLDLCERGSIQSITATVYSAGIKPEVAQREAAVINAAFELAGGRTAIRAATPSPGPGNVVQITVQSEQLTELFYAVGMRGKSAETVAQEAVAEAQAYIASGVPVGDHLADQLQIPFALAGGGSYVTANLSDHSVTNLKVIETFLDKSIQIEALPNQLNKLFF